MEMFYCVVDHCEDSRYRFTPNDTSGDAWTAEEAANDYHSNHDGWESSWPLTFRLFKTEDGPPLGDFEVAMEYEPVFSGRPVQPAEEAQ